jgi:hypothetical protein
MRIVKMPFGEKYARLRLRLQDREWRQYGALLLAGKLAGVALLILGIFALSHGVLGTSAFAADPELQHLVDIPLAQPSTAAAPATLISD